MGDTSQESASSEAMDEFFEPIIGEMTDDEDFVPVSSEKHRLAEKRRRAEQRLEQLP